jgi:PTH1 family peptidyl-tRNA hydrolase
MLVVGLGNPGTKYSLTKHNFGFWVLDKMIEKSSLTWKSGYGDYLYAKDKNIIFAKPTSLMNHSGVAIKDLCNHYNESKLIIVYDDIDLSLGSIRFKESGGTGGHKGIESIIYQLETEDFHRLKLGIALDDLNMRPSEHYVLKPFPKKYREDVDTVIMRSTDALDFYFKNSITETMNKYN